MYVKDQGGVAARGRRQACRSRRSQKARAPGYDTSESCNADPACSFAKGPGKPHCKKRASPKRASPKRAPALPPLVAATPFLGPAPAGVATARARVMGTQAANYAMARARAPGETSTRWGSCKNVMIQLSALMLAQRFFAFA